MRIIEWIGEQEEGIPLEVNTRSTVTRRSIITVVLAMVFVWLPAPAQDSVESEAEAKSEAPKFSRRGADGCLRCHDEEEEFPVLGIFRTAHGSRSAENSPFAIAQCEGCHGPSGAHEKKPRDFPPTYNFGLDEETPVADQDAVCLTCHGDEGRMGWMGSAHEEQEVPCAGCHQVHIEHDPVASADSQQQVCFDCHQQTRAQTFQASSHPLRFGKMSCSSCHESHNGHNEYQLVQPSINDTCYTCHAEKTRVHSCGSMHRSPRTARSATMPMAATTRPCSRSVRHCCVNSATCLAVTPVLR